MKILLVSSRTKFGKYGSTLPPLGLASVASRLVKEGFEVRILDQPTERTTKEGFEEYLLREKPDVITFGAFTMEMPEVAEEARAAKRVLPNVKTVIGGYHVISLPTETLDEFKEFDFGAAGEGQCLVNLANALRSNLDFADFKGIVYRENGKAVYTGAPPKIMDLDGIPFPTYDLLPMKKYRYQQERTKDRQYFTMMTMRGCPFQCTFCANAGSFAGMRSVKNVLEEIDVLYNKYGVRAIGFLDDTFNITKERVMELCEGLIKRNYDLVWGCLCRVAPVDDEMLGAMKKAGCAKISYGVESGNQEILNLMKKGITLEQIRNTFALTRKNGIITLAYAMINHPDETRENINETKKFVKSLKPDYISVAILCPMPGSEVFAKYRDKASKEWGRYQEDPFEEEPLVSLGELSPKELQTEIRKFLREFYLNPKYIAGRMAKVRSLEDLSFFAKKAFRALKYWRGDPDQ